jgi:hypothetical protein
MVTVCKRIAEKDACSPNGSPETFRRRDVDHRVSSGGAQEVSDSSTRLISSFGEGCVNHGVSLAACFEVNP